MLSTLVVALLVLVFALVAGAAGWLVWRLWTGTSGSAADASPARPSRTRPRRADRRGDPTGPAPPADPGRPGCSAPGAASASAATRRSPEFRFGQEVTFTELPGKPFVHHLSRSWLLDDDGNQVRPLAQETGYWRPEADGSARGAARPPDRLRRDLARRGRRREDRAAAPTWSRAPRRAKEYTAGHRLYGLVDGDLLWAYDMAAVGQPLQPHLSGHAEAGLT